MKEIINLPLLESVKRTYLYFIANFKTVTNVALVWVGIVFLADCLVRFPSLCSGEGCNEWSNKLFVVLEIVAGMAVSVAFSRAIILKEKRHWKQISLGLRELKYLGYSLFILALLILSILFAGMLTALLFGTDMKAASMAMRPNALLFYFIVVIIASIYSSRFSLILPAVAVDDKELNLKKSFQISTGNSIKIFAGIILSTLPTMLLLFFLGTAMNALQIEGIIAQIVFSFLSIALSLINTMLKACYLAHIYQYFMYFYNQSKEEEL